MAKIGKLQDRHFKLMERVVFRFTIGLGVFGFLFCTYLVYAGSTGRLG